MKFDHPCAGHVVLLGLLCVALNASATLDTFGGFCGFGGGPGTGFAICAEAAGGGGGGAGGSFEAPAGPGIGLPDRATSDGPVAVGIAGGGSGGAATVAYASGDYGLLRATAIASISNNQADTQSLFLAVARAGASFHDVGTIESPNLVNGTPVHAKAILDIGGAFGKSGEARFHVAVGSPSGGTPVNFGSTLLADVPTLHQEFDLTNLQVGADLIVNMEVIVSANAFAQGRNFKLSDTADVGNTAHFYLDFLTDDVRFQSRSGHDYSAPVPVPAVWPLVLAAFGALSFQRRRADPRIA